MVTDIYCGLSRQIGAAEEGPFAQINVLPVLSSVRLAIFLNSPFKRSYSGPGPASSLHTLSLYDDINKTKLFKCKGPNIKHKVSESDKFQAFC